MKRFTCMLWMMGIVSVHADFITSFPVGASNNFQYAQIGTHGADGFGAHNSIAWDDGFVRLQSRYLQPVSRALIAGDNGSGLNNGVFSLANGDIQVRLAYNYFAGNSDTAMAEVALHMLNSSGANNYPVYYVRISTNTLQVFRHQAFSDFAVVATTNLALTVSGSNVELIFTAASAGGSVVDLNAYLVQDNAVITSVAYTDLNGYQSGYAGFAGGDARNTATFYGIDATGFYVGTPLAIPEPSSILLIGFGLLALAAKRFW